MKGLLRPMKQIVQPALHICAQSSKEACKEPNLVPRLAHAPHSAFWSLLVVSSTIMYILTSSRALLINSNPGGS